MGSIRAWQYWWLRLKRAANSFKKHIRAGWRNAIGFLIQSAVVFVILYYQPWFGDWREEALLVPVGAVALATSVALTFLVCVARAPVEAFNEQRLAMDDAARGLRLYEDARLLKSRMLGLCRQGRDLLGDEALNEEQLQQWIDRALENLNAHYDENFIYEFETTAAERGNKSISQHAAAMVSRLENIALSWGSIPERHQSDFTPNYWRKFALVPAAESKARAESNGGGTA